MNDKDEGVVVVVGRWEEACEEAGQVCGEWSCQASALSFHVLTQVLLAPRKFGDGSRAFATVSSCSHQSSGPTMPQNMPHLLKWPLWRHWPAQSLWHAPWAKAIFQPQFVGICPWKQPFVSHTWRDIRCCTFWSCNHRLARIFRRTHNPAQQLSGRGTCTGQINTRCTITRGQ